MTKRHSILILSVEACILNKFHHPWTSMCGNVCAISSRLNDSLVSAFVWPCQITPFGVIMLATKKDPSVFWQYWICMDSWDPSDDGVPRSFCCLFRVLLVERNFVATSNSVDPRYCSPRLWIFDLTSHRRKPLLTTEVVTLMIDNDNFSNEGVRIRNVNLI